jgi:transcriptional regulator with XRE-family HTH domain
MNHLAKNMKLLRKNSSKRQGDIGFLVHKGQTTIGNWENGKSEPNIEELLVISNFFDISIDVLLKVDLAKTNFLTARLGQGKTFPLSKENTKENAIENTKENDDNILSYILQEIKSLRQEFKQTRTDQKT